MKANDNRNGRNACVIQRIDFRMDSSADLLPYTNGIPHEILHGIIRR